MLRNLQAFTSIQTVHNASIAKFIEREIDLTPKGIIDRFDLFNYNNYSKNCTYGHFGNKDVPWERIGW